MAYSIPIIYHLSTVYIKKSKPGINTSQLTKIVHCSFRITDSGSTLTFPWVTSTCQIDGSWCIFLGLDQLVKQMVPGVFSLGYINLSNKGFLVYFPWVTSTCQIKGSSCIFLGLHQLVKQMVPGVFSLGYINLSNKGFLVYFPWVTSTCQLS